MPDGKYLWINDLANGRLARIRVDYFEADRILKLPNMQGAHGIAVVSPNTKYIVVNGEFELPTDGLVTNPAPYTSLVSFVDPDAMQVKFQVRINGNIDIADTSKDGRYSFSTVYNLEQGNTMGAMIQYDRDAVAAIDIPAAEKAVAAGRGEVRNGVPILDPEQNPGVLTLIPVPKNPHGINVTPDGRYAIAAGKLSPTVTIIDAHTLKIVAEPEVGRGPLHTTFDDRGNAFTSLFLDSQVVKWNIDKAVKGSPDYIVDRINVHYNIGHLQAVGGDHLHPAGDYLIALNKLSKDMYMPVGPDLPENQEIIDISGEKMKMLASFPTPPEPHDAYGGVGAEAARPQTTAGRGRGGGRHRTGRAHGASRGDRGHDADSQRVYARQLRGARRGSDHAEDHERRDDSRHDSRLRGAGSQPEHRARARLHEDDHVRRGQAGRAHAYCTNFCSALHLEMRGRMVVQPKDSTVTLADRHAAENVKGQVVSGVPSSGDHR
jgi:nitrous-oxide reductase